MAKKAINTQEQQENEISLLSLQELDSERAGLIDKVQQHMQLLNQCFVARDRVIELATLCAMLGEPLLLLGPPGTGKSLLCRYLSESLHIPKEDRFEYLLTPFTEPSELFGPIDLNALKSGRYLRRQEGTLPHAKVAFIDEIFRANSSILNALLSLLNDGVYYEEGQAKKANLSILFAASNHLPHDPSLLALSDRFMIKIPVDNTHEHSWDELLHKGLNIAAQQFQNIALWQQGPATYIDLLKLRRYLDLSLAKESEDPELRDYFFPPQLMLEWQTWMTALSLDIGIYISDRKLIRLYRMLRGLAILRGRNIVQKEDFILLRYVTQKSGEQMLLDDYIYRTLGDL